MLARMLCIRDKIEVFLSVVSLVVVHMMYDLFRIEQPADPVLYDHTMKRV